MALASLARISNGLKRFIPNMGIGKSIGFESRVAAVLSQNSSPLDHNAGLSIDDEGNITLTTQVKKSGETEVPVVRKLATLGQGTIIFDEEEIDKLASTRNTTIAMVVSLCLLREDVASIVIPASYWKNTNHPFHFNEGTGAIIVRSLGVTLDQVSFAKKGDTIEIRKK